MNNLSSQFIIYQTEGGQTKIEVRLENETVWLTQQLMADLFQTSKQNISHHIKSIYEEGELEPEATVKNYLTVRQEGKRQVNRPLDYYNLDMIISVGYRVKSHVATKFRIWATQRLQEFIIKGFVLDDERLKNPDQPFDYFDELLKRIQDIRTSFIRRSPIFMPPASITIPPKMPASIFLKRYKTSCIGRLSARRQPKSLKRAPMPSRQIWA
jgi:hypothetical protein